MQDFSIFSETSNFLLLVNISQSYNLSIFLKFHKPLIKIIIPYQPVMEILQMQIQNAHCKICGTKLLE